MAIEAFIFDLGGVILELDWEKYREDKNHKVPIQNLWSVYEKLNPALAQFLVQMRPRYKLATICNGGSREAMNRKFRLHDLVDLMVFDEEEGVAKPDARIYLRTLQRLGVQPEEAVFMDDKMENVEAARQLGMHSIHFENTEQALAEIQKVLQTA
jgi:epoxide hydrolase-like predicted phosphatase